MESLSRLVLHNGFLCLLFFMTTGSGAFAGEIGDIAVIYDQGWVAYGVTVDTAPTLALGNTNLGIWVDPTAITPGNIGGFDFLLCAAVNSMELLYVEPGPDLPSGWEYLTYRKGPAAGGCAEACDGMQIRIRGIANLDNGVLPPPETYRPSGCIARMVFSVSGNWAFMGQCNPVAFCSAECHDNVLTSVGGDTLYLATSGMGLEPGFDPMACAGAIPNLTVVPSFSVSTGYICVLDPDPPMDMNLNGIGNEVGDYVLFSNFMRYGPIVWTPPYQATQVQSSDYNNDGVLLTPADLFILRWYLTGTWLQFPHPPEFGW